MPPTASTPRRSRAERRATLADRAAPREPRPRRDGGPPRPARGRARRRAPGGRAGRAGAPRARGARRAISRLRRAPTPSCSRRSSASALRSRALGGRPGRALGALEEELRADSAAGEALAGALRDCASEESDAPGAPARARRQRDLGGGRGPAGARSGRRGARPSCTPSRRSSAWTPTPAPEALPEDERVALRERVERLARRREALGPVNPLAAEEYREAVERVEELEGQRADLEIGAARAERADPQHRPRDRRDLRADLQRRRRELRGADRRRLPRRPRAAAPRARGSRAAARARAASRSPAGEERRGGRRGRGSRRREAEEMLGVEIEVTPGGQVDEAALAALGRREVDDRDRLPLRRLPRAPVPVLHPRRGRGGARRPQHRPFPHAAAPPQPAARSSSS